MRQVLCSGLIGRDAEMTVLAALAAARAGQGGAVVLLGEAGVGKSAWRGVSRGRARWTMC